MNTVMPAQSLLSTAPSGDATAVADRYVKCLRQASDIEQPFDLPDSTEPLDEPDEPDEPSDVEGFDFGDDDDADWDVFIPDDEYDLEPEVGDFTADFAADAWHDEPE